MISKALFKRDLSISLKLWLVVTAVMALLLFALFFATSGMEGGGAMVIQQYLSEPPPFRTRRASQKLFWNFWNTPFDALFHLLLFHFGAFRPDRFQSRKGHIPLLL